jgi:serine phosphatase RsbU (regulator of sigma subunit)
MHTGTLATAAVARLEGLGCRAGGHPVLRWANAGHPPPALVTASGEVRLLTGDVPDLMLGVDHEVQRAEHTVALEPGATIALYTDGLVERRGSSLDEGFERLRRHLGELAGRPVEALCEALLDRMLPGTPQDDVALVAVSLDDDGTR